MPALSRRRRPLSGARTGSQLTAEAAVFCDHYSDDLSFPSGQPAGHAHPQELEGGGVDGGPQLISRPSQDRVKRSAERWNTTRLCQGHHLRPDVARVALPRCRHGSVLAHDRGVGGHAHYSSRARS